MTSTLLLVTVFCVLHSCLVRSQKPENQIKDPCQLKATCHDCIQTPTCAWCFARDVGDQRRCFKPSGPSVVTCADNYTYIALNEFSEVGRQKPLTINQESIHGGGGGAHGGGGGSGIAAGSDLVQVYPQRVSLKMRIKETYKIQMQYTQAEDYPVDLYYLMDLSKSMEDDKDKLSKLGGLLAESMQKITSNFRLGFGSFVDKVVMPYVSTIPKKLREPCENCEAPYGFRNHMTLSTNTSEFSKMVAEAAVSGNLDAPEGGFDAIMQAIVCKNEIGWRDQARRLLVFSTDASFHYAGDGKLGGIVRPNDGHCHLDSRGMYSYSSVQDYPSISQINLKVKQNSINVIFAVTEEQYNIYERLQKHVEGSTCGRLKSDSANVVDLVKEQYQQISSSVEMKDNATSNIKISYFSRCLNRDGQIKNTSKCDNIKVGDIVNFTIHINIDECPPDPKDWKQKLKIYPVGINESLIVDLEMLCSCPCEHAGSEIKWQEIDYN